VRTRGHSGIPATSLHPQQSQVSMVGDMISLNWSRFMTQHWANRYLSQSYWLTQQFTKFHTL